MMTSLEFWSSNYQFGIKIKQHYIDDIIRTCAKSSPNETGGIIIGFYNTNLDCAIITQLTKPTNDSKYGRTWFYRGIQGLQEKLNELWHSHKHYYLGEWHFHPFGVPQPSKIDVDQMNAIATSSAYKCPEPVLLIISGDPKADWEMKLYIFKRKHELIELYKAR
jgi:integrative and conjugative element protein (TIGR02256 family)